GMVNVEDTSHGIIPVVQMRISTDNPGIKHVQIHQIAKPETPVDCHIAAIYHGPDWHPLKDCTQCCHLALCEISVTLIRVMIFGTVLPGIVCHLMVIPDHNERYLLVQLLKISIASVDAVSAPIIRERNQFTVIIVRESPPQLFCISGGIAAALAAVFINVVAKVHNGVQTLQSSNFPV